MDERVVQFRVGAMVLGALIATAILLVMFGKLPQVSKREVRITCDNAAGTTKWTPVRKSGILIGRVAKVDLVHGDRDVEITLDIQKDKTIYKDEDCLIAREMLGDTMIVFVPSDDPSRPHVPIDPDEILTARVADDPTGLKRELASPINTVKNTGKALASASNKLGEAADRVKDILDADAQKNVKSILDDAASSLEVFHSVLGDKENQKQLAEALRELPDTLKRMNKTFAATDDAIEKFTRAKGDDGRTPLDRMISMIETTEATLNKFSMPGKNGEPAPVDQVAAALQDLHQITGKLASIADKVDRGDGTVAKLLNDPDLYLRLDRIAKNVERLTRELRPIVEDAGVLMDKGARHPGVFIRDAVKPGPGIK
jgi:phospholipid/cholesterol/gamma-HCH transport system substrate-binding protein